MQYMIDKDGQQWGPYTKEQVQEYLNAGNFQATDLAWHEGLTEWRPLSTMLTPPINKPVPPPVPSRQVPPPIASKTRTVTDSNLAYAGFCIRLAAWLIDGFVLTMLLFITGGITAGVCESIGFNKEDTTFPIILFILCLDFVFWIGLDSCCRGSIGQKICNLKVTDINGDTLALGSSICRSTLKWFFTTPFYTISALCILGTQEKQALHDLCCKSLVLHKNPK